ncbi:MAG: hypothetical protein ACRERE_12325 [Candidatus Entotheonellia bacterium]
MRTVVLIMSLLCLTGFMAVPVDAAEFRVTGFFDNIIPHADSNLSRGDRDLTRNEDQNTFGRERARFFFNFIANDDLRGVFALEIDSAFGAPSRNFTGSRCVEGTGTFRFEQCGFDNGIDNNNFEVKHLYVDFRIPQLPSGNRFTIGGLPTDVTPLHSHLLYSMDGGGGNVRFDFTEKVSLLALYIQLEEDLDRFTGSAKVGEDYIAGGTLMLKPLPGLDLHLLGLFGHLQQPFGPSLTGTIGPFIGLQGGTTNIATEARYYLGFDSRYRLGNLSIEPTFIYLLGNRRFTSTSAARTGFDEIDFNAFETQLVVQYTWGQWLFAGKAVWASGNKATEDINNTGNAGTRRSDVNRFLPLGVDNFHRFGEYNEILGRSRIDSTGTVSPFGAGELAGLDVFGLRGVSFLTEYKATDRLTLEGALGAYWADEKTGCPATLRTGSGGACSGPTTNIGAQAFDFTGNSRYLVHDQAAFFGMSKWASAGHA